MKGSESLWVEGQPFEIRMTNGDVHPVRHPEVVMLVGGRAVVGYPETERIAILSLLHVAAIEMLRQVA